MDLDLSVLPPAQRAVWDELNDLPDGFTLYGGTAFALQLGHRQSIDFDLFTWDGFEVETLLNIPSLRGARTVRSQPGTFTLVVERNGPVQVSFFSVPRPGRVRAGLALERRAMKVAHPLDLAGTKAAVV